MANFIIIGGGFYGCRLALALRQELGGSVTVLEQEAGLMQRASYHNQARVHRGYHYPRSLMTALRSRMNYDRFVAEYADCVADDFENYYAVARVNSKVSGAQFRAFYERIGAPVAAAPKLVSAMFNADLVEQVFAVQECAFDAARMAVRLSAELQAQQVVVQTNTTVTKVEPGQQGFKVYGTDAAGSMEVWQADYVFNCTYANLNSVLAAGGLEPVPLKQELAELALVEVPDALRNKAVTVMCGPFFSLTPFPAEGLHILSHVRYTPHRAWHEPEALGQQPDFREEKGQASNFLPMQLDAQRYLPLVRDCRYVRSLWAVKTLLPATEQDDARPILFRPDSVFPNFMNILGGKIDNVYDMEERLRQLRLLV